MKKYHHIQILDKIEHVSDINKFVKKWVRSCGKKHIHTMYTALYTHYNRTGIKKIKEMFN